MRDLRTRHATATSAISPRVDRTATRSKNIGIVAVSLARPDGALVATTGLEGRRHDLDRGFSAILVSMPPPTVSLRQVEESESRNITEGVRPGVGWADDFPAKGDLAAMRMARLPLQPDEPWSAQWLIVVDDVVSGTIGFKGAPRVNEVEIGYGVVPSRQRRGVAAAALSQLLALIAGRSLDVLAETATWNEASQSVLRHAGFQLVSQRRDVDDSELLVWRRHVD
jgi:RimJ/RimL family protein N-acetyltransferase